MPKNEYRTTHSFRKRTEVQIAFAVQLISYPKRKKVQPELATERIIWLKNLNKSPFIEL